MNDDIDDEASGALAMAREAVNEAKTRLEAPGLADAERAQCRTELEAAQANLDALETPS